jgi:hypothetical protein
MFGKVGKAFIGIEFESHGIKNIPLPCSCQFYGGRSYGNPGDFGKGNANKTFVLGIIRHN